MTVAEIRSYCGQIYADTYADECRRLESEILAASKTGVIPVSKEGEIETSHKKKRLSRLPLRE